MKSLRSIQFVLLSVLLCLLCLMAILSAFRSMGRICPKELRVKEIGKPIITHEAVRHNYLGINQIVSTQDEIYIMYSNYGVISVYKNTGTYMYSISVYSHKNGRVRISVFDDLLYVQDKAGNIYRFQGDTLLDFLPRDQAKNLVKNINFDAESKEYFLKGASIHRQTGDSTSECVISRPFWLIFTQAQVAQPLLFVCALTCFVIFKLLERKSK